VSGETLPLSGRQPRAVRNALSVLQQVARAGPGVTAKEISAGLRLAPATTYRLLNVLVEEEYLRAVDQSAGEGNALLLAAGDLADLAITEIRQGHSVEHLLGAAAALGTADPFDFETEGDVVAHS